MSMVRTWSLERALPTIVSFITGRTGVKVLRSDGAKTDGDVVYVPRIPDLAVPMRVVVKYVAYIWHECFHLRLTDFPRWYSGMGSALPLVKACVRVLEDIRIEYKGSQQFPAARRYLKELVAIYSENGMAGKPNGFPPFGEEAKESDLLQWYMLYKLRHDLLQQEAIAPVLEITAASVEKRFARGMRIRLDALMFEVVKCESTDDVFALSEAIAAMIKDEKEKEEEQDRNTSQSSTSDQTGEAAANAGSNATTDPTDEGEDQTSGDSTGEEVAAGKAGAEEGAGEAGSLEKLLSMGDGDITQSIDDMLEQELNADATALNKAGRGASMPNVHKLPLAPTATDLAATRAAINAIRTRTLHWMASQAECDVSHSQAGTLMDFSRLHMAKHGGAIFVRSDDGIDLNAAVSFVVDRSGSMCDCIGTAVHAALVSMLAFDVPGMKSQVTVFPVYDTIDGNRNDEGVAVIKCWEESPRDLAGRIGSLATQGGTPMAEAILFAATDIVRREETLRMVVVVTDGAPDDKAATREVIEVARRSGVVVAGLGIGVDPSPVFGKTHSAALDGTGSLSAAMVKIIKAAMTCH